MYRPDFLVIGMERSGTHWVGALLNNHPDIACFPTLPFHNTLGEQRVGEMHFFNTLASVEHASEDTFTRPFSDFSTKYNKVFADLVHCRNEVSISELYGIFRKRYSEFCDTQRGNKKIVGEGTSTYVFHLDFIDFLYPKIKKLCIIRDPKDKIVSWHCKMLRDNKKKDTQLTRQFAIDYLETRIVKEYKALLAYNGRVHCLLYEALSKHTHSVTEDMLNYLHMQVSPSIISHMTKEADFKKQTARDSKTSGRKRGEEDIKSGFRKGIVGDWKNYMSRELANEIDDAVRDLREKVIDTFNIKKL